MNGVDLVPICAAHARRLSQEGDVQADRPVARKARKPSDVVQCQAGECIKPAQYGVRTDAAKLWVCSMHRQRWLSHKSFEARTGRRVANSNGATASRDGVGDRAESIRGDRLAGSAEAELTLERAKARAEGQIVEIGDSGSHSDSAEQADEDLLERFGPLIAETAVAFSLDTGYTTDIISRARQIQEARAARTERAA